MLVNYTLVLLTFLVHGNRPAPFALDGDLGTICHTNPGIEWIQIDMKEEINVIKVMIISKD